RIAELSEARQFSLRKTKVQELVFLLNELSGVDTGYKFCFYTYGPFSSELAGDVDYLDRIGVLNVEEGSGGDGYSVTAGKEATKIEQMVASRLDAFASNIEKIVVEFGGDSARDLELIATLVYISKYDPEFSGQRCRLVTKARELKPKFSNLDVEKKVDRLSQKKFLSIH
ncbi:MAG: hypothetical protein HY273_11080, partial [Gammaproteobacteria bacterium]|nr:hypothetical protein [Gammaproteobacteria bacterium]